MDIFGLGEHANGSFRLAGDHRLGKGIQIIDFVLTALGYHCFNFSRCLRLGVEAHSESNSAFSLDNCMVLSDRHDPHSSEFRVVGDVVDQPPDVIFPAPLRLPYDHFGNIGFSLFLFELSQCSPLPRPHYRDHVPEPVLDKFF